MRICIVAMAPGRKPDLAGHDEIYALAWDDQYRDLATHLFEPHTHDWYLPNKPSYIQDVNDTGNPVVTLIPGRFTHEIPYPDDQIPPALNYYESSFAYMLAYAIHKNPSIISVYGIRMATDEEYAYQRANAEYMIGYARGAGIEVNVNNSTVCQYSGYFDKYPKRYGDTNASR